MPVSKLDRLQPKLDEAIRCPLLQDRDEEWIRCCTARFLPLARLVAGNAQDAEDALHEAWIIALENVQQYRGQPPACGWMRTIVKHEALHVAARRGRETSGVHPLGTGGRGAARPGSVDHVRVENEVQQHQLVRILLEIVDHLPRIYREVVLLRDLQERSSAEVGSLLHLSQSGVRSRLQRAHRLIGRRLRQRIARRGRSSI